MENKLDKKYLLDLYHNDEEDNMIYALTILKSLGLKDWFKNKNVQKNYYSWEIDLIINNSIFIDMFDLDKFSTHHICLFIKNVDNGISYFNQRQLNKLYKWQIDDIINVKPESEKYFINCNADLTFKHLNNKIEYIRIIKFVYQTTN